MRASLAHGDVEAEAQAASRLARHLLALDAHLDEAVKAGRRAIALAGSDDALRRMLSEALRTLGEPGLAAAILRPVVDSACARASRETRAAEEAVTGLVTLGDLLLRAGDVDGALESFRYVAVVAPERPDGQERVAMARGIAPSAVPAEVAARAYIGAAKKHQLAGDDARSLEALARAFECDPASPLAANVLADSLEEIGRVEAADAVRAEHAHVIGGKPEAGAVVHAARREKARMRGDRTAIVAAVLDELVDLVVHTDAGSNARETARSRVDAALDDVEGLGAARRRLDALLATGSAATAAWRALANAPSAPPARRVEAFAEVASRDITDEAALSALREHARVTRDATAIVDALVRVLRNGSAPDATIFGARAAELAGWADEQLDDAPLAAWAWRRLLAADPTDKRARDELGRLAARVAEADRRLSEADRAASSDDPSARLAALRERVRALLGRPDRDGEIVEDLAAIFDTAPGDAVALATLERLSRRLGPDDARRAAELRERAARDPATKVAARVTRVELALRRGDVATAVELASEADDEALGALLVVLAVRAFGAAELAEALAKVAGHRGDRAVFLAAAARAARLAGRFDRAVEHANAAMNESPRDLRGAVQIAELAASNPQAVPPALAGLALERALGGIGARGRWSLALAQNAEAASEGPLAAAWTRRAWSLRPGDLEVARLWLRRAVALEDADLVAEVVRATTSLVTSLAPIAGELASALRALLKEDPRRGEEVARELLTLGAARLSPLREAILGAPTASPELVIAVQERWLASGAPAAERSRVLLSIAETARTAGDASRAADAAARIIDEPDVDSEVRERAFAILSSSLGEGLDADAELALRQALGARGVESAKRMLDQAPRAHLSGEDEAKLRDIADDLRALGRDLWDLAEDREAALRAWLSGARLLGGEGVERLEADIGHFGGDDAARDALFELAHREDVFEESRSTSFARAARSDAFKLRAFERLLDRPPSWVEPISLARDAAARASDPAALLPSMERLIQRLGTPDALHDLYEIAAGRTAGRYGARGVHYRAARVLDRLGRGEEALAHAVRAFSAVPSEGAMLVMLERLARGSRRADVAISALVEAAEQADDAQKKTTWLDRAASIAEGDALEPEERVDLLLRLFLTAPTARTAEGLVSAVRAAIELDPATRDTGVQRLVRAHRKVEGALGYSERLPVLSVVVRAIAELDRPDAALMLLAKGASSTPRSDLDPLRAVAEEIAARDPEAARAFLDRETAGGVLRAHMAWGAGDPDRAVSFLGESAPAEEELDLEGSGPHPHARDLEQLERWGASVHDKRVLAAAWERFGHHRGAAADLEAARALDEAGQTQEAARVLIDAWRDRANEGPAVIAKVLELARAILPHAGAEAALVDMLVDDLQEGQGGETDDLVARWREIAEMRALRLGDRRGALEALVEAGRLAPSDDELWNEISEVAESIGAHERLAAALAQRLQRARPDKRVALLRKLARVLEHDLGRDDEAAERWGELVRLLPLDAEAADALERISERRGDTSELLELLRARAARLPVGHAERTRALRRIARELGGVAGRRGEVLSALREVHQQNPGDLEVALQLAQLARSAGDLGTAAEALMRAFRATTRDGARVHLGIEGARVLLELHDYDTASRLLHEAAGTSALENDPRALDLVRLQLEVAIARSDAREEALARIRIAELDVHAPAERRAAHFSASARALLSMGDAARAKELAWKAARAQPSDVGIASLLAELEFGVATGKERRKASAEDGELLGILSSIPHGAVGNPEQLSVVAFARAELLDLARGPGAGYQDLNAWSDEVRAMPLVQLALAERLAAEWSFGQAAAAYERAFAGDLRGLRAIGPAALQAADAAARSNDSSRAKLFLDLAARDPACRIDARKRAVELARAVGDETAALRALERLAAEATGNVRAQALADQAQLLRAKDPEAAAEAMKLAVQAAEEGTELHQELVRARAEIDSARASRSLPPAPPPSLRDSGITSNRGPASYDRSLAMMLGGGLEAPSPPSAWIAPQSDSQPPPLRDEPAKVEVRDVPRVQPPVPDRTESVPPPRRSTERPPDIVREERSSVPDARRDPSVANMPSSVPPPPGPAGEERTEKLSEHPRLTMVGDAPGVPYRPRSMPALPRPAAMSGALDLETLDKIALDPSAPAAERVRALKTLGEAAHEAGEEDKATRHFISALELGDIAAGDQAAELLALLPGRGNDLLLVRRRQVFLAPGDRGLLDALHGAALGVRDLVFARAIDHVRRAFDPVAGPVPPPPLDAQLDRPDLVLPLLERRANPVAAEALRITWENASLLFRKEPTALGRSVERVTTAVPIGRVVAMAGRLLGTSRTPVYLRQRAGRDVEVVLLSPPAVVLGGDCREETHETRYALGAGIVAAHPAHCLLLAQPEANARQTWHALLSAFGPPEHGRGVSPEVGRLGAALWQSIPRAAQRRLGELLGAAPPSFETALEGARQVARRGGLYLSGDLAAAVRSTLAEIGESEVLGARAEAPDLAAICAQHPKVADLFRLATSPEFAEARWRGSSGPGRRGTPSTGGTRGA